MHIWCRYRWLCVQLPPSFKGLIRSHAHSTSCRSVDVLTLILTWRQNVMVHSIMIGSTEHVLNVREPKYWACLFHSLMNGISFNCACLVPWPIASWTWHNGRFIFGHPSEMSEWGRGTAGLRVGPSVQDPLCQNALLPSTRIVIPGQRMHASYYSARRSSFVRCARKIIRIATVSFVVYVCPYVRLHGTTRLPWTDFHEIWYLRLFRNSLEKQCAGIYLLQNHSTHVSGVHRTHHQEYIKL